MFQSTFRNAKHFIQLTLYANNIQSYFVIQHRPKYTIICFPNLKLKLTTKPEHRQQIRLDGGLCSIAMKFIQRANNAIVSAAVDWMRNKI